MQPDDCSMVANKPLPSVAPCEEENTPTQTTRSRSQKENTMASFGMDGFSRGSPEKVNHLLIQARKSKEEANKKYQEGETKAAIRLYHRSLLYLKSITQGQDSIESVLGMGKAESLPQDTQQKISKLTMDNHNNLAACLMKKESPDYDKIVMYCNKVITVQSDNHKAHFRRGVALFKLKNFDKALESFLAAKEHMGTSVGSEVKRYIDLCHKARKQEDEKLKTTYQNMFSRLSDEPRS